MCASIPSGVIKEILKLSSRRGMELFFTTFVGRLLRGIDIGMMFALIKMKFCEVIRA